VFLLAPLFNINLNLINIAFSLSFVLLGFIIGYKSPGVTLKEPAVAGAIAVVGEWLFIQYGIQLPVPVGYVAFGVVEGFFADPLRCLAWRTVPTCERIKGNLCITTLAHSGFAIVLKVLLSYFQKRKAESFALTWRTHGEEEGLHFGRNT